jgi:hypothetical protein
MVDDICQAHLAVLAKQLHCRKGFSRGPKFKVTTDVYWVRQGVRCCGPAAIACNKIASNDE